MNIANKSESKEKNDHISILGICCARDVFGLQENDGGFTIDKFCQSVNPVACSLDSLVKDKPLPDSIFEGKTNFYRRNIELDLKKGVFDFLSSSVSDWLTVDSGSFRKKIFFSNDHKKANTLIFPDTASKLKEAGCIGDYTVGDLFDLPEDIIQKSIDDYCNNILLLYPQNKIILMEFYDILHYYDSKTDHFGENDDTALVFHENNLIRYGFMELKKRLPNAHIVKFPFLDIMFGDPYHKWGKAPLHYVREYYDYAIEAVFTITKKLDPETEKKRLTELLAKTESILVEKYGKKYEDSLSRVNPSDYYSGLVYTDSEWHYVKNGRFDRSYRGLTFHNDKWWYINNGKLDKNYNGLYYYDNNWWYIKDGCLDKSYTGITRHNNKMWYIKNGMLDKGFSGEVYHQGKKYNISDGQASPVS